MLCAFKLAAAWVVLGVALTAGAIFELLTLRIGARAHFHHVARFCGKAVFRIVGVEVRVVNPERLAGRATRLVAFNHSSQIDLFVFSSMMPPYGTPIAKREFYWVPFLGWFMYASDVLTVDRSNIERAKRSFAEAARRLREDRATIFVAPEGTRSRDGGLGPFKMGLFHLAKDSRVPITPALIRGAAALHPMGQVVPHPGVLEVEFLPDVPTDDYTDENLKEKRDELRAIYSAALGLEAAEGQQEEDDRPRDE